MNWLLWIIQKLLSGCACGEWHVCPECGRWMITWNTHDCHGFPLVVCLR